MLVDLDTAIKTYETFRGMSLPAAFHPQYLYVDSLSNIGTAPKYFVYEDGGKLFFYPFLLGRIPDTDYFDAQSPYGYGGPISNTEDIRFLRDAWTEYSSWCASVNVIAEFVRFHPLLENWRFYRGTVKDDRATVWINLGESSLLQTYDTRVRTAIKKAINFGVKIEWMRDTVERKQFQKLYRETMSRLNAGQQYYFNDEYFDALLSWERTFLAIARKDNEIVSAAVFLGGDGAVEYHLSASNDCGRKYAATNLLIHEGAMRFQSNGCAKLHLGGGTNSNPENPLLFFKSGFSNHRSSFKIGQYIHNVEAYENLRARWINARHNVPAKVLFYRF